MDKICRIKDVIKLQEKDFFTGVCLLRSKSKKGLDHVITAVKNLGYDMYKCCAVFTLGVQRRDFVEELLLSLVMERKEIREYKRKCKNFFWSCAANFYDFNYIASKLKTRDIYIDDSETITPTEIVDKCLKVQRENGQRIEVIIINNIRFMKSDRLYPKSYCKKYRPIIERLDEIAKELDVLILAVDYKIAKNSWEELPDTSDIH
ncbi:MAG: hypothetical protein IJV83_00085 [Clostridia bacterium]|nr:hypothetical protein [Clostridia bacterium]